jgi:hypothetical protein
MQLSIAMKGDQRLTENLIVEVRAMAKRYGLAPPSVEVVRKARMGPRTNLKTNLKTRLTPARKKSTSSRKTK